MELSLWIIAISLLCLALIKGIIVWLNYKKPGWNWGIESKRTYKIIIKCSNCSEIAKTTINKGEPIIGSRATCTKCGYVSRPCLADYYFDGWANKIIFYKTQRIK